jgi:hypothetical protein
MTEFVFERGLFATLAAALIVPELTTFLIFVFVIISVSSMIARQAWAFVHIPAADKSTPVVPVPAERTILRLAAIEPSSHPAN